MNWNILVTLGKEIKRDSTISVNESRAACNKVKRAKPVWIKGNLPLRLNIIYKR